MTDSSLLDALDALRSLPPAAPPQTIARITRDLIGARRTTFFGSTETGVSRRGVDDGGNPIQRPPRTAADLEPFYIAADDGNGLVPLYDLEPGPWISIRLDAGTPRGAIVADGLQQMPTPEEIRTWRAFGASLALRLAITHELIAEKQRAETDALTGTAMRSVAFKQIDQRLRDGQPTTVIVIDLDNFKTVNDTFGHQEGDRVLVQAANALRGALRTTDLLARFGGDEFLVVSDADPPGLIARLEAAVASDPVLVLRNVGASIGYASSREHGKTRPELFEAADAAMYAIKEAHHAAAGTPARQI
jgi:diguanylate cyclase (GGDEF)-like protein